MIEYMNETFQVFKSTAYDTYFVLYYITVDETEQNRLQSSRLCFHIVMIHLLQFSPISPHCMIVWEKTLD